MLPQGWYKPTNEGENKVHLNTLDVIVLLGIAITASALLQ